MRTLELYKGTAEILAGVRSEITKGNLKAEFTKLFVRLDMGFDPIRFGETIEAYETIADVGKKRKM